MIFQCSGGAVTLNIELNQSPRNISGLEKAKKMCWIILLLLSVYLNIPNVHLSCIKLNVGMTRHNHSFAIGHWALNIDIKFWNENYTKAIFWQFIYLNVFQHLVGIISGISITSVIIFFWGGGVSSLATRQSSFVIRYDEFDRSVKLGTKVKFNWKTQAKHTMDLEIWNSHFHLVDSYKSILFFKDATLRNPFLFTSQFEFDCSISIWETKLVFFFIHSFILCQYKPLCHKLSTNKQTKKKTIITIFIIVINRFKIQHFQLISIFVIYLTQRWTPMIIIMKYFYSFQSHKLILQIQFDSFIKCKMIRLKL